MTGTLDLRSAFAVRYGDTWARELWHGGQRIWSAPYNGPSHVALVDPATVWADTAGTVPLSLGGVCARLDAMLPGMPALLQATEPSRPRFGRHPTSGIRNLLTGTAALATQSRTVAAVQHTLSFRGAGTVTLSGASTAGPLVGTGAGDLVSLTFTPSAGTLTLTVSGSISEAQLEVGAARSAYQAVTTQWDVTEAGQADVYYLESDGVDDWLRTDASIDLAPFTDVTAVLAMERLINIGGTHVFLNHGSTETGALAILKFNSAPQIGMWAHGSTTATSQLFPPPSREVITAQAARVIGGPLILRRNLEIIATATASVEIPGISAQAAIAGRSNGNLRAAMRYYGHVLRGGAMTAAELATAETYLMRRIGLA